MVTKNVYGHQKKKVLSSLNSEVRKIKADYPVPRPKIAKNNYGHKRRLTEIVVIKVPKKCDFNYKNMKKI